MNILVVVNDPPYGSERPYNALRHANALGKRPDVTVRLFLIADAVQCARRGQNPPAGYYNLERMLTIAVRQGAEIAACGSCLDARGLNREDLLDGVHRGSMEQLADWTLWADRVVVY
ncbi:MAG: DsrE family protein [Actinomycetia bacterium]|nr:DsrE family protein [Actinomycetes bacterium]